MESDALSTLALDRTPGAAPLPAQIAAGVRGLIASGALASGDVLASSRSAAETLGVARGTVSAAYDQLAAEGYLVTRDRSGVRVAPNLSSAAPRTPAPARRTPSSPHRPPLDFSSGHESSRPLDDALWRSALRAAVSPGGPQLTDAIAQHLRLMTRLPGGICKPKQWLALDEIACVYGNGTLRLTTRQAFQFHGVVKRDLKATMAAAARGPVAPSARQAASRSSALSLSSAPTGAATASTASGPRSTKVSAAAIWPFSVAHSGLVQLYRSKHCRAKGRRMGRPSNPRHIVEQQIIGHNRRQHQVDILVASEIFYYALPKSCFTAVGHFIQTADRLRNRHVYLTSNNNLTNTVVSKAAGTVRQSITLLPHCPTASLLYARALKRSNAAC